MGKVVKKIVLSRNYEYDDNFYSHYDNVEVNNSFLFDNIELAEEYRRMKTFESILDYPTCGNLRNVLNSNEVNMRSIIDIFTKYVVKINNNTSHIDFETDEELLKNENFKYELYPLIKDLYYVIVDIEVNEDNTIEFNWENNYAKEFYKGILEDNKFLLHSVTDAALVTLDDYDIYKKFYLKGKLYEKEKEWLSDIRKYKIENILKNESDE